MLTDKKLLMCLYCLVILFLLSHSVVVWHKSGQSEFNFSTTENCHFWIGLTYVFLIGFSYVIEHLIIKNSSNNTYFKDISLEFKNLPLHFTEKEFLNKCNDLMDQSVLEVSFLYDLKEYYNLKDRLQVVLEEKQSIDFQENEKKLKQQEELEEYSEQLQQFEEKFKKNKDLYFTGRGFITFRNYKFAYLFKLINDKMHEKLIDVHFDIFTKKKPLKKFQAVANKLVFNKQLRDQLKDDNLEDQEDISKNRTQSIFQQKPLKAKKKSQFLDLAKVSKLYSAQQFKDVDESNVNFMSNFFGEQFEVKKCMEAETINFKFQSSKEYSKFSIGFCILFFLVFLPYLAYLFNYWYYYSFIERNLIGKKSPFQQVWEIFYLILTVALDLFALSGILFVFNQKYFIKTSEMYEYRLIFNVFYILLTNVIVPNMSLKDSFEKLTEQSNFPQKIFIIKLLMKSLYTTVFLFMFQGINFKIVTPFIMNKYIIKSSKEVSFKDNFLFSISYLINVFLQISFYGSILIDISLFFIPFVIVLFLIDYIFIIKSDRYDRSLPFTIFSNTAMILICGVFPVSFISLQSMAISFEEIFKQSVKKIGFFERIINSIFYAGNSIIGFFIQSKPVSWTLLDLIFMRFENGFKYFFVLIFTDKYFLISVLIYIALVVIFWSLNNEENFQDRVQSKIWKKQEKIENLVFQGQSYKNANPAYQILGQFSILENQKNKQLCNLKQTQTLSIGIRAGILTNQSLKAALRFFKYFIFVTIYYLAHESPSRKSFQ